MGLILFFRDVIVALADAIGGRARRRYEHSVAIRAPRALVWEMLRARELSFDGSVPLRIVADPVPGQPALERVRILAGDIRLQMLTRIVAERPGEAILYELLPHGTDASLIEGDDDYIGFVVVDTATGSRLDLTRETSPRRWLTRLTIPLGLRAGARRYRRKAEAVYLEQAQRAAGDAPA